MSRTKIVAGNWKMNLTREEAGLLVNEVKSNTGKVTTVEKIFIPAFPFLMQVSASIKGMNGFHTAAQNCSEHAKGAFTGEVSAAMLKSAGCQYVLVGHSERRQYYSESAKHFIAKIQRLLEADLKIIFCFGEQLKDRQANAHFNTVEQQLTEVLQYFPPDKTSGLVLAYEPVWAIGTGETASPQQAQEMHAFVRGVLAKIFNPQTAASLSILYSGSCNASNARELFACPDVDGGLIGGASLNAEEFCNIIYSF